MKRDIGLDFIRILAIYMIVNFHFSCLIGNTEWFICVFRNGEWGCVGTTMFFILSGYVLHMKYKKTGNLLTFYKKRFLSIYPMFYVVFLISWVYMASIIGKVFYGGNPLRLLYTVLGIDGYLNFFGIPNYYQGVGEWFTAVIVVIYLLYPVLNFVFAKARILGTVVLAGLYLWNIFMDPFAPLPVDANLITGIFLFWLGMLFEQYHEIIKKHVSLLFAYIPFGLLIMYVGLPGPGLLWKNFLGIVVFLVLLVLLAKVRFGRMTQRLITYFSGISFAVYLTHHFILVVLQPRVADKLTFSGRMLAFYAFYMILVTLCSTLVNELTNFILGKRKKWRKLDLFS